MRFSSLMLVLIVLLVLTAAVAPARQIESMYSASPTLAKIDAAEAEGALSVDEAALNRIYHIFDRSRVDARFLVEDETPGKSATMLIHSIQTNPEVSADVKSILEEYLDAPFDARALFISPSGIFKLTYYTTGGNAVPPEDLNSNGVPDFVEWCADYMDYSWQVEITDVGFRAPGLTAGYYLVSFEDMPYYGYTQPTAGTTRIVLHNNFLSFPSNDDPDGDQKGAAKVTCAHEFKHASQYTTSHGREGGWVEVDAVWAEELVYPATNDYHWYVGGTGSPLTQPHVSLDSGGTGSYEDCIWQICMSEKWGNQLIVDFWSWRATHTGWGMLQSYDYIVGTQGMDLSSYYAMWTHWNYLTGARSEPPFGYPDALEFNTAAIWLNISGLGVLRSSSVPHLATKFARHHHTDTLADYPKIVFDGAAGVDFRPQAIVLKTDGTLVFDEVEVDASGHGEKVLDYPFSDISEMGLSFANCEWSGTAKSYSYQLFSEPSSGVEGIPDYGMMRLYPNYPNPFNPKTKVRFALASALPVDLTIVSPGGRVVRHLVDGEIYEPGEHHVTFDGKDDAGRDLPSGIYFAKLNVGGTESQLAKMTLLK